MLQDFHFKIIHRAKAKHADAALSRKWIGKYEADKEFGGEIQDLDGIAQDISMFPIAKGNETINNLFIMMEEDVTLDHTKGQAHKEKEITMYQDEEQYQRIIVGKQGPKYIVQGYWNLAHEAQTLVDDAKTKIMIEQEMDGDEQNRCLDILEDLLNMKLLVGGSLDPNECIFIDIGRTKRKVT